MQPDERTMSLLQVEVRKEVARLGASPDEFEQVWQQVLLRMTVQMVDSAVARAKADSSVEDYKGMATAISDGLNAEIGKIACRWTRKHVARLLSAYGLLCGYDCPRTTLAGLDAIRAASGEM